MERNCKVSWSREVPLSSSYWRPVEVFLRVFAEREVDYHLATRSMGTSKNPASSCERNFKAGVTLLFTWTCDFETVDGNNPSGQISTVPPNSFTASFCVVTGYFLRYHSILQTILRFLINPPWKHTVSKGDGAKRHHVIPRDVWFRDSIVHSQHVTKYLLTFRSHALPAIWVIWEGFFRFLDRTNSKNYLFVKQICSNHTCKFESAILLPSGNNLQINQSGRNAV